MLSPSSSIPTTRVSGLPSWLPAPVRELLAARMAGARGALVLRSGFSAGERRVLRKRRRVPVSEWAERHRVVTESSRPGRWSNATVPYLAGIMDASFFASVEEIVLQKAVQTGGSEAVHTCVGYAVDRDPGPAMYVYPDQDTARDNARDRITPMLRYSRRLASYLGPNADDVSSKVIRLVHMLIHLAWAHSVARLANKPVRYLVLDEVDKYPEEPAKGEAGPVALAEKRLTTYRGWRKCWKLSTPTVPSGAIHKAFRDAQWRFDFWVRCPHCNFWQLMAFDSIKWPADERDPVRIYADKLASYLCPHCGALWDDHDRDRAVRKGEWRCRETGLELFAHLRAHRPVSIAFQVPAWLSPFVSLSECAKAFLLGVKKYNPGGWRMALRDFCCNYKGEPWEDIRIQRDEDRILALADDRPEGMVPGGGVVSCLLATADTQDDGWWYEIRAWGWGGMLDSWAVRQGFVTSLEALQQVCFEDEYQDAAGKAYPVRVCFIDAMGHQTKAVYEWAVANRRRVVPCKGEDKLTGGQLFTWSKSLEYYTGSKRVIPGGLKLLRHNTNLFKDALASRLEVARDDPGAYRYHAGLTEAHARQMCAEYVDEARGVWLCPEHKPNHLWDCAELQLVAAEVLGIKHWRKEAAAKPAQPQPSGPDWVKAGDNWIR